MTQRTDELPPPAPQADAAPEQSAAPAPQQAPPAPPADPAPEQSTAPQQAPPAPPAEDDLGATRETPAHEQHEQQAQADTNAETSPDAEADTGTEADTETDPDRPRIISQDGAIAFRRRWEDIELSFVDEPRDSVRHADELVEGVVREITEVFGRERQHLEGQWDRGDQVSTEDLRIALQRYRAFFERLLHT